MRTTTVPQTLQDDELAALDRRRRRLRRWLRAAVVLVAALTALRWWWGAVAHRRLQAEIDRLHAAGEPLQLSDFAPRSLPDDRNAALLLQQAASNLVITADQGELLGVLQVDALSDDANRSLIEALVAGNAAVLESMRRIRGLDSADWQLPAGVPVFTIMLPYFSGQRQLARVLRAAALLRHHYGDDAETIELARDALDLAEKVDTIPFLIGHLVSIAIADLGFDCIEKFLPDLSVLDGAEPSSTGKVFANPATLQALIRELLDESGPRQAMKRALQSERLCWIDTVQRIATGELSLMAMNSRTPSVPPSLPERVMLFPVRPLLELDAARLSADITDLISVARESSWTAAEATVLKNERLAQQVRVGARRYLRPFSAIILPSWERAFIVHFRNLARRRLAAVALALRLYELDHGQRPEQLADLVPDYLEAIPKDPFDPSGGLVRYLPEADPPRLYSISDDGADDAGRPQQYNRAASTQVTFDVVFFLEPVP